MDALGIDARYEGWETAPEDLTKRLESFRSDGVLGSSVTIPHKESVMPLLDEVSDTARKIGSVNTIVSRKGRLTGHNTDAPGFLRGLRENGGFEPRGKDVVVVGDGGCGQGGGLWIGGGDSCIDGAGESDCGPGGEVGARGFGGLSGRESIGDGGDTEGI